MRTLIAAGCLLLGFLAAFLANVAVWADRTVFDEEQFVATASPVFDDGGVQDAIATELVDQLMLQINDEPGVRDALPTGLRFLAAPLSVGGQQLIIDGVSRALALDLTADVRARLLRGTHSQAMAILEGRSSAVETRDGVVYLDLQPVLDSVLADAGIAGGVLGNISLPDGAGRVEIARETRQYTLARPLVAHHNATAAALTATAFGLFVVAILLTEKRRHVLALAGALVFGAGAASLLAVPALRDLAAEQSRNPAVAGSVIDLVAHGFLLQSVVVALAGLGMIALAVLVPGGPSRRPRDSWS